jgi:DNA-binding CsgD family transcriptional regulator
VIDDLAGIDVEAFSATVAGIYDAAVDPALWPKALLGIREFVNGQSATIYTKDVASHTGGVVYDDGGISQDYRDDYFRRFVRLDPTFVAQYYATIGEPMATADFLPYEEFLTSRFYREWALPQHLVDFAAVALERSATNVAMFGVFRHERHGVVDQPTRAKLRLLAPHVRRAVAVGRLLDRYAVANHDLVATLDGLGTPVILLDAQGGIRHTNAAALALIERGTVFRAEHGRLYGSTSEVSRLIGELTNSTDNDLRLGPGGIAVPLGRDGEVDLIVHALPLAGGRRAESSRGAALALMVSPAGPALTLAPPEIIARRHSLTPAELRILLTITEFGGVPATAEALGISQSTVKFHLKNLSRRPASIARPASSNFSPTRPGLPSDLPDRGARGRGADASLSQGVLSVERWAHATSIARSTLFFERGHSLVRAGARIRSGLELQIRPRHRSQRLRQGQRSVLRRQWGLWLQQGKLRRQGQQQGSPQLHRRLHQRRPMQRPYARHSGRQCHVADAAAERQQREPQLRRRRADHAQPPWPRRRRLHARRGLLTASRVVARGARATDMARKEGFPLLFTTEPEE